MSAAREIRVNVLRFDFGHEDWCNEVISLCDGQYGWSPLTHRSQLRDMLDYEASVVAIETEQTCGHGALISVVVLKLHHFMRRFPMSIFLSE